MTDFQLPPPDPEEMARRLRKLREDRGWTRAELADKSDIGERTIRNIETARGNPSDHTKLSLARALGCTVPQLTGQPEVVLEAPEPVMVKAATLDAETLDAATLDAATLDAAPPAATDTERTTRPWPLYLVLLGLTLVLVFMLQVNQRVASLEVTKHAVTSRGAVFGNTLWTRSFQSRVTVAHRTAWQGDDVVVGLSYDGTDGCRLLCLDGDTGEDRWQAVPDPDLSLEAFGPASLQGLRQLGAHLATWVDFDGDGEDELAVTWMHIRSYPEHVMVLDRDGRVLMEYANRGHLYSLMPIDPEQDGIEELLVSAVNNALPFNSGSVFILDRQTGRSAAVDAFSCEYPTTVADGARSRVVTRHWGEPYMTWMDVPRLQSDHVLALRDDVGRPVYQATVGAQAASLHLMLDAELRPLRALPTDGLPVAARSWPEGPRGPLESEWLARWMDEAVVLARGKVIVGPAIQES